MSWKSGLSIRVGVRQLFGLNEDDASGPEHLSFLTTMQPLIQDGHVMSNCDFALVGGNESRLAQFLVQKQVDAAALRSVTVEQLGDELPVRKLGTFANEWKTLTQSDAVPYIGVGAARSDLVDNHPEVVARVIAAAMTPVPTV